MSHYSADLSCICARRMTPICCARCNKNSAGQLNKLREDVLKTNNNFILLIAQFTSEIAANRAEKGEMSNVPDKRYDLTEN